MLQQPWVIHLIVGAGSMVFLWLGIFIFIWSDGSRKLKLPLRIVSVVFGLVTLAGATYIFRDVFWIHWTYCSIPEIITLISAGVVITLYSIGMRPAKESEIGYIGIGAIIIACSWFFIPLALSTIDFEKASAARSAEWRKQMAAQQQYNANIIPVETPKYREEKIELLSATDSSVIEGSLNGEIDGTLSKSFFVVSGSILGSINGEIKQIDVYKFDYFINTETREVDTMVLDAKSTRRFLTKEGETPYLLKKIKTYYSLDKNVEPAQECYPNDVVEYELHIPESMFVGIFKFDKQ